MLFAYRSFSLADRLSHSTPFALGFESFSPILKCFFRRKAAAAASSPPYFVKKTAAQTATVFFGRGRRAPAGHIGSLPCPSGLRNRPMPLGRPLKTPTLRRFFRRKAAAAASSPPYFVKKTAAQTATVFFGRGRRARTLKNGFGDRYVTITSCPYSVDKTAACLPLSPCGQPASSIIPSAFFFVK